jgi:REP element-mobilizing transposase RayT
MGLADRIDFHISGQNSMTHPLRIQSPGTWYHITSRGNEHRDIFADDADRCQFLSILRESCAIYGVEIHGYVLMTNHFHFVVHTPQANLNRFMQRFNTTYTVHFNRRHHRQRPSFSGALQSLAGGRGQLPSGTEPLCAPQSCQDEKERSAQPG